MIALDNFDRAILEIVQTDTLKSHRRIGEAVNLSASSVRRRLEAMRRSGVITADVALVDPALLGLSFITSVSFAVETPEAYAAFEDQMRADPAVSQCYSVSGDQDFLLIVHATSPEAYEAWGKRALMGNPAIGRYSTSVVWSRSKFTPKVTPA